MQRNAVGELTRSISHWNAVNTIRETAISLSYSLNSIASRWRGKKIVTMVMHYWSKTSIVCSVIFAEKFLPYSRTSRCAIRKCERTIGDHEFTCAVINRSQDRGKVTFPVTWWKKNRPSILKLDWSSRNLLKGPFSVLFRLKFLSHLLHSICNREKGYDWRYSLVIIGWFFWIFNEKSFFLFSFYFLHL